MIKTTWLRLQVSPADRPALRPLRLLRSAVLQGLALLLAASFSVPFIWSVLSSLKAADELYVFPPRWLPAVPQWSNYLQVWLDVPFGHFYLNTILIRVVPF